MFKAALLIAGAEALGYNWSPRSDYGGQHDAMWNHAHYEPGNIGRFDNHYAEIYGVEDGHYGRNGFRNFKALIVRVILAVRI